jgi:hypothetical protein
MKKIYEFPILWSGWELDAEGWVALDDNGKMVIVLTNHGSEYVAAINDLPVKIRKYKTVIEATEKAPAMVCEH